MSFIVYIQNNINVQQTVINNKKINIIYRFDDNNKDVTNMRARN